MKNRKLVNYIRLFVQIVFIVISPTIFSFAFNGIKALVTSISQGTFENLTTANKLGLVLIIFTFLFGRFFCGWICSFGAYNDIVYIIGSKFIKIKNTSIEKYNSYLRYLKYFILFIIICLCITNNASFINGKSPWDVFGQIVSLRFRFDGFLIGIILLVIITIGCLFVERFFCRYLCPLGAIFSIVDRLHLFELHKENSKCGKCRICTNECSMGIKLYKENEVKSGECIKCYKCEEACPRKNFEVKVLGKKINKYIAIIITLILIISMFFGVKILKLPNTNKNVAKETSDNIEEYSKTEEILGTVVNGKIRGSNAQEALEKAFERAKELEQIMSVNISDSELNYLNDNGYNKAVNVSDDLYYVIDKGIYYGKITDGALDITIGNLIDKWGIGTDTPRIISHEECASEINLKNYNNVELDPNNKTIKFLNDKIKINLGAIAKGYIADEMKKVLTEEYNIKSGILNLGGNVLTIGTKENGEEYNVGICNPKDTSDVIDSVKISDKTVVTSGNYERYFIGEDGKRYHHILDPSTGYPAEKGYISTTIIADKSIDADALSTATYVLGKDKAKKLIDSLDDVEAIFITDDMNIEKVM